MWIDVVDLRDFYDTGLGQMARRLIRRRVRACWPDVKGQAVLGLGYATPYLTPFRTEASRVMALMPASQGVLHWPPEGNGLTCLGDEAELPFPDLSVDRVLLVHALECTEQVRPLLREVWRVLAGSGRLLVVVPNRTGLWAHFERTPFGHGRPYSQGQIAQLLRDCLFTPGQTGSALFMPPARSRMVRSSALALENIGGRWSSRFGGVVVAEATKQIYGADTAARVKKRRAVLALPQGNRRAPTNGRTWEA